MRVFISHATEDQTLAAGLVEGLENRGVPTWLAARGDIPGGDNYAAEITRQIMDCRAVVVLVSGPALDSVNVRREVNIALEERKLVLPVAIDPRFKVMRNLPADWRYWLSLVQMLPMASFPEMVDAIVQRLAQQAADGSANAAPTEGSEVEPSTSTTTLPSAELGQPFGPHLPSGQVSWPSGPYRRCDRNRLHLISADEGGTCLLCLSGRAATAPSFEARALDRIRMIWGEDPGVGSHVRFSPEPLVGRTLIKVHSSARAWFVELHADGTCTESTLGDGEACHGDWGCDSAGLLVLANGGFQLAIVGSPDGINRGLEFQGNENPAPMEFSHFRVGVVAFGGRTNRAVKWVAGPRAFAVDWEAGGAERAAVGVEAPLFGGPAEETVDFIVEADRGSTFDVVTRDVNGIEYRAAMVRSPGTRAIWKGIEHHTDWQGQPQTCTVTMAWVDISGWEG